jgi:hypothetical protein
MSRPQPAQAANTEQVQITPGMIGAGAAVCRGWTDREWEAVRASGHEAVEMESL